jgi:ankyrin repeat protein
MPNPAREGHIRPATILAMLGLVLALLALSWPTTGRTQARTGQASEAFWDAIRLDEVKKLQTEMLRGSSANALHPEYGPAIVMAARERSPKCLAYLARLSGTRLDAANSRGETALMLVALQGELDSVRLLVERGASVNRPGWTPLHYAAAGGHVPVMNFLIEEHAYLDAESPNRTTPLMMTARQKHTNAMRMLVEAGADPGLRNEAGYTAADYMDAHGEQGEAQWLREQAADFRHRYGTVEKPRPANASVPASIPPPPAEPTPPRLPGMRD